MAFTQAIDRKTITQLGVGAYHKMYANQNLTLPSFVIVRSTRSKTVQQMTRHQNQV